MNNTLQVAIDGPAGAGKSTISKILAEKLNIIYLDTGAMYRAFTFFAMNNNVAHDDDAKILCLFNSFDIDFRGEELFLNGENITKAIRTPEIDRNVSFYAKNPLIRGKMVALQQRIAGKKGVVMEGRDIGTVVLKDAPFKFYLDASVEVRAERRFEQNQQKGIHSDLEQIKQQIKKRDEIDSSRESAPLTQAEDSIYIDTSDMTLEKVISTMVEHIKKRH